MKIRRGKFIINKNLLENHKGDVLKIMSKCIITRAEYLYYSDGIEYYAESELFDFVDQGEIIPEYKFTIDGDNVFCEKY